MAAGGEIAAIVVVLIAVGIPVVSLVLSLRIGGSEPGGIVG